MALLIYRGNYFIPSNKMQIVHQTHYIYLLSPYTEHLVMTKENYLSGPHLVSASSSHFDIQKVRKTFRRPTTRNIKKNLSK